MEPRKPGILEMILATASTAIMTWCVISPQERYWIKLRSLQSLYQLSDRLARLEGHQGMGEELKGRDPSERYVAALYIGRVREYFRSQLEGMKP